MAGGSHACYNWPGHEARSQCANCNNSQAYEKDPNAFGCSSSEAVKARGVIGGEPYCELCCPENYTEDFYDENPEQYKSHPGESNFRSCSRHQFQQVAWAALPPHASDLSLTLR